MTQTTERGRHGLSGRGARARGVRALDARAPDAGPARRTAAFRHRPGLSAVALTAVCACGAALLLSAAAPAWAGPAGSKERDVQLVYCLDPARLDSLVAAAVRLRLLRADSTTGPAGVRPVGSAERLTAQEWADRHEADFSRACSALMAATSGSPATAAGKDGGGGGGGWLTALWQGVLLSAAGALLTLLGQTSERVSAERRELRRRLAAEEAAFRSTARTYLTDYESDPRGADHPAVRAAREALAATLLRVPGPEVRRRAARRLAEGLPLPRPLPAVRNGTVLGADARTGEARGPGEALDTLPGAVSDLDRPPGYWSLRAVRERSTRHPRNTPHTPHTPDTTPGAAV
ncbi:hypothetical protein ACFZDK_05920 [Streptomyces sp. NPDC007901]|uniref:hypothetical protein n=1 Tax=Streptomyces sp. NPDC007901 TaxID=3364785 RepID=UPI0036F125A7